MPAAAETVTIRGVELVKAGTWRGRTGPVTITDQQIAAAALAGADPEVDEAALKFGHVSTLNGAALGDGAPAFGWVQNLRLKAGDAGTLIGDLVDVPAKLAAILPKAFRRRSAELAFDVRTPAGKVYAMTLTGLAALGATPPAVKGLADLPALYNLAGAPDADHLGTVELAAGIDDPAAVEALDVALAALAALDIDDGTRTALAAAVEAAAGLTDVTIPAPAESSRQNDDDPNGGPAASPTSQETETMDDAKLRELLKLEQDADLEAELAKLIAGTTPPAPAEPVVDPIAEPEPVGAAPAALSADVMAALAAAGVAVVSAETLAALTAGADVAQATAAQLSAQQRTTILDDAQRAGKITPTERPAFEAQLAKDLDGTSALLSAMAARFPTAELGNGADTAVGDLTDEAIASFVESLNFGQ